MGIVTVTALAEREHYSVRVLLVSLNNVTMSGSWQRWWDVVGEELDPPSSKLTVKG